MDRTSFLNSLPFCVRTKRRSSHDHGKNATAAAASSSSSSATVDARHNDNTAATHYSSPAAAATTEHCNNPTAMTPMMLQRRDVIVLRDHVVSMEVLIMIASDECTAAAAKKAKKKKTKTKQSVWQPIFFGTEEEHASASTDQSQPPPNNNGNNDDPSLVSLDALTIVEIMTTTSTSKTTTTTTTPNIKQAFVVLTMNGNDYLILPGSVQNMQVVSKYASVLNDASTNNTALDNNYHNDDDDDERIPSHLWLDFGYMQWRIFPKQSMDTAQDAATRYYEYCHLETKLKSVLLLNVGATNGGTVPSYLTSRGSAFVPSPASVTETTNSSSDRSAQQQQAQVQATSCLEEDEDEEEDAEEEEEGDDDDDAGRKDAKNTKRSKRKRARSNERISPLHRKRVHHDTCVATVRTLEALLDLPVSSLPKVASPLPLAGGDADNRESLQQQHRVAIHARLAPLLTTAAQRLGRSFVRQDQRVAAAVNNGGITSAPNAAAAAHQLSPPRDPRHIHADLEKALDDFFPTMIPRRRRHQRMMANAAAAPSAASAGHGKKKETVEETIAHVQALLRESKMATRQRHEQLLLPMRG